MPVATSLPRTCCSRARAAGVMQDRVVGGRPLDQAREHRRLLPGQARWRGAEVAATRGGQAIVPVAEVSDIGVHLQDLRVAVGQVELDGESHLLGLGERPRAPGRVQHLGQLLVDGRPTLVALAGDRGLDHPRDGKRVDPGLPVEPVILRRHQGLREAGRHRRARVDGMVRQGLRPGQCRGIPDGRRHQQQNAEREHAQRDNARRRACWRGAAADARGGGARAPAGSWAPARSGPPARSGGPASSRDPASRRARNSAGRHRLQ